MRTYRRNAFTLIEMLISVTILSLMMIFLYKTYASINLSNEFYKKELNVLEGRQLKKKVIFLDLSLTLRESTKIENRDRNEDVVFIQTSNSLHNRFNPYVTYIVNDSKLYRLESLVKLSYPISQDIEFDVDYFGEVDGFRLYKNDKKIKNKTSELFLVHIDFKKDEDVLMKVRVLNEK